MQNTVLEHNSLEVRGKVVLQHNTWDFRQQIFTLLIAIYAKRLVYYKILIKTSKHNSYTYRKKNFKSIVPCNYNCN